jgi:hypothetical protein
MRVPDLLDFWKIMKRKYKSVQFWPVVGRKYKASKLKLLVLGESHYPWKGIGGDLRHTTQWAMDGKEGSILWKRVSGLFDRGADFWDDVIFYNFVQYLVGKGPRDRPEKEMWEGYTVSGFKEVLCVHRPDRILVLGKTNWQMLPGNEHFSSPYLPRVESRFPITGERFRYGLHESDQSAYWYPTGHGGFALCAPIFHPAYPAGFYRPETRETVKILMKKSWKLPALDNKPETWLNPAKA